MNGSDRDRRQPGRSRRRDLDVYIFLKEAPDAKVEGLEGLKEVRAIATLSGQYAALGVATLKGYERLQGFLDKLRALGDPDTAVLLESSKGRQIVHSQRPQVVAFIQLWVEPRWVRAAFEASQNLGPEHLGSSIVAGGFDILVEVGGPTFEEVKGDLLGEGGLQRIPGLLRSATSFGFVIYYPEELRDHDN